MHLVLVHGFLLSGSGSNIYTANVAKTWKAMGHAVTVICQDRNASNYKFVDEVYIGTSNIPATAPEHSTMRVVVPSVDDVLIVYMHNKYEGYSVKVLGDSNDCSFQEINKSIANIEVGLKKVLSQGVDHVLANHLLLNPVIVKQACDSFCVPYDIKIHGSAITFALKKRPELIPYAIKGLSKCKKIVVGSSHVAGVMASILDNCTVEQREEFLKKLVIIPPGMDPNTFKPLRTLSSNQHEFLKLVKEFIIEKPNGRNAEVMLPKNAAQSPDLRAELLTLCKSYDPFSVDSDLLSKWPNIMNDEPVILYYGAYLHTKGVGELIVSFPHILKQVPKARLVLIGYGNYRDNMEGMISALRTGNVDDFISYAQAGDFVDCSATLLRSLFRKMSAEECDRITITGILQHKQLCEIIPLASVAVFPIKAPEAFGMVTIEAMSCGVLPICTYQTGIKDVLDTVKQIEPDLESIMHIEPFAGGKHGCADGAKLVEQIPVAVVRALSYLYPSGMLDWTQKREVGERLRAIAMNNFAWDKICSRLMSN